MVDRIANPWGERTPYGQGEDWPHSLGVRLDLPRRLGHYVHEYADHSLAVAAEFGLDVTLL